MKIPFIKERDRKGELRKLWRQASIKELIYLALHGKEEVTKKRARRMIRVHGQLTMDHAYDLMEDRNFPEEYLWGIYLGLGPNPEDLFDTIKYQSRFETRALKMVDRLIESGSIKTARARRLLIQIIKEIPPQREWAWERLRLFDLSIDVLRDLRDFFEDIPNPKLQFMAETLITRQAQIKKEDKLTNKIEKLVSELKQKEKKTSKEQ